MGCMQRSCRVQVVFLGDENVGTGILACDLTRKFGSYDGTSDILLPSKLILERRAALPLRRRFFVHNFSSSDFFAFS